MLQIVINKILKLARKTTKTRTIQLTFEEHIDSYISTTQKSTHPIHRTIKQKRSQSTYPLSPRNQGRPRNLSVYICTTCGKVSRYPVISSRSTSQRVSKRLTGPGSPRTIFPSKYETNRNTSDGRANDPPAITLPVSGVGRGRGGGCR